MSTPKQLNFHFKVVDGLSFTWDPHHQVGAICWMMGEMLEEPQFPFIIHSPQEFAQLVVDNHGLNPPTNVFKFLSVNFDTKASQHSLRDLQEYVLDKVDIRKLKDPDER